MEAVLYALVVAAFFYVIVNGFREANRHLKEIKEALEKK